MSNFGTHVHRVQEAILKLFQRLPKGGEGAARLQTLMFSATLHSPAVRDLAIKICHNPIFVDLKVSNPLPSPLCPGNIDRHTLRIEHLT